MFDLLWVIGIAAATYWFYRYVQEREAEHLGGGDPIGRLEAVATARGAPFFVNTARTVATVYFPAPRAANVRMTSSGACAVVFPLAGRPPFSGVIYPTQNADSSAVSARRGLASISVAHPDWVARFSILADNAEFFESHFTTDVINRFLVSAARGFPPRVVLNQSCARIDTLGLWRTEDEVRAFIDLASFVADAFSLSVDAIEFQAARGAATPLCSVCGAEISRATAVVCPHCETPHHDDCWAYNGGCALFGCAGAPVLPVPQTTSKC